MSEPLTKRTIDHSGVDSFSFSFFCDICGKEWRSPTVAFKTGGITIEHEEARTLLWAKEHSAAFEAANLEAHLQFNHCEKCGKWVCENCYDVMDGDLYKCRECNK
jgi:hypothetical protein